MFSLPRNGGFFSIILWRELEYTTSCDAVKIEHLAMLYLRTEDATPHTESLQVFDLPKLLPPLLIGMARPRGS